MKTKYFLAAMTALLLVLPIACSQPSPTGSGGVNMNGPAPTPTAIAASSVTVTVTSVTTGGGSYGGGSTTYRYALAGSSTVLTALTIHSGTTVTWDTTAASATHPFNLDNGSMCLTGTAQTGGYSYPFSTTGTFYCHCSVHGTCGTVCPGGMSCSGMAITISVIP